MGSSSSKESVLDANPTFHRVKRSEYGVFYILKAKPIFQTTVHERKESEFKEQVPTVLQTKEITVLGLPVATETKMATTEKTYQYISYFVKETDEMKAALTEIERMLPGEKIMKSRKLHYYKGWDTFAKDQSFKVTPLLIELASGNSIILCWRSVPDDKVEEDPSSD